MINTGYLRIFVTRKHRRAVSLTSCWFRSAASFLLVCGITFAVRAQTPNTTPRNSVSGTVTYSDTHNPVRRADVTLLPLDSTDKPAVAVSDRLGEFRFDTVEPGRYLARRVSVRPNEQGDIELPLLVRVP
jgi:hypothetical protein